MSAAESPLRKWFIGARRTKSCLRLAQFNDIMNVSGYKDFVRAERILYMNYIVLDLEWNQSNHSSEGTEVKGLNFEIIEIGAIKLDSDRTILGEFSELIKPQVYHELHYITSRLIHMQMQELERGRTFPEVMQDFLTWCGEDYIFCTWGPLDLTEMQKNMKYYEMEPLTDGPLKFLDVQKLFSLDCEDGKSRRALEYAVDFLDISKDIPFHRAFSDAYYTAKVLADLSKSVLQNYSYDVFVPPKQKQDEIHIVFENYAKYISRQFDTKAKALDDKEVNSVKCYICRKNIRRKIRWFTPNGKNYYCVGYCDKHGYIKGKIRMRKSMDDKIYVVKTNKIISKQEADEIKQKQEHAKEIKKHKRKKT